MITLINIKVGAAASLLAVFLLVGLSSACPVSNEVPLPSAPFSQCEGAGYTAFDVAHHAEQDLRVGAYTEIGNLLGAAVDTPADAGTAFASALALYTDSAAGLQTKVQERSDDHLPGAPVVGVDIDARVVAAFAAGAAATTQVEVEIAAESIDKALVEFFFLSVFHELVQGQAAKWDEAFGYYGAGADNALDGVQGFANVAKKRDANNGTALEAAIFQSLARGSCLLATRLNELETESVDVLNDPELSVVIDDIDVAMRQVLAASAGHEAFEIALLQTQLLAAPDDVDLQNTARVKLVELDGFLRPIVRLLRAEGNIAVAEALQNPVTAALTDLTPGWIANYDAANAITTLETAFAIDIVE